MALIEYEHPFDLAAGRIEHQVDEPYQLREWIARRYGHVPDCVALVVVNGQPYQAPPDRLCGPADDVRVLTQPGDTLTIIQGVLTAIAVASAVMNRPPKVGQLPDPSPTYNINAQRNQARLGAGVPVQYGTVRVFPDLAAQTYTVYKDNDQYLYQLFCIGLGEFSLGNLFIDDSDVDAFDEITYETYYNAPVTLFPTNVETSAEPASQVLTDDEANIGPYAANTSGTDANRIEVDLVFPQGFFRARDDGNIDTAVCPVAIEYREIDDAGSPVAPGTWSTLFNGLLIDQRNEPVRITKGIDVTAGRYEVQCRRSGTEGTGPRIYNRVTWEGMRAYIVDDAPTFTDMTMLAVVAKATGNLTQTSAKRFNVVAQRKVPIWNGSSWSANTATNAIAWALADLCRNSYLGNQGDAFIDLAALLTLDSTWSGRGDEFNYRFDQEITLYDAVELAAKAGRAFPVLNAGYISFTRVAAQTAPATIYNRDNIVKGSFRVEYDFRKTGEPDAILAEYIDPDQNYQKAAVLCQPPTSSATNQQVRTYHGISDRDQAFKEGVTDAQAMLFQRVQCKFQTELEGHIPQRGQLVKVVHESFDFDQGGEVVSISGLTLKLSEPPTFTGSDAIYLRQDDGSTSGPHLVSAGATAYEAVLSSPLGWTPSTGPSKVRTLYSLGAVGSTAADWVVHEVKPMGGMKVELTCLNYVASIHTVDSASTPTNNQPFELNFDQSAPVIDTLIVEDTLKPGELHAAWSPAPGAERYVVQVSYDSGTTYHTVRETINTFMRFLAIPGTVYVRVAGIGASRGPWKGWNGTVNTFTLNTPTSLAVASELVLDTSGKYVTKLTFSFTAPTDDYLIQTFEAQYKLARHGDWQPLYNALEDSHVFETPEIGAHQFRVRSVYLQDEIYSTWAETSETNLGTYTALAAVGINDPTSPKIYLPPTVNALPVPCRIEVSFDSAGGAVPEFFVLFYAVEQQPNQLAILTDNGSDKLYLDESNNDTGVAGAFQLTAAAGSTTTVINYTDNNSPAINFNLSGKWWLSVDDGMTATRYHKVVEASSTQIKIPPEEELDFAPGAGDTINVLELDWHDARLDEFKLVYIDGEVIQHGGIDYDGNYYLEAVTRGAEGTSQASQSGKIANYWPATGPGTQAIVIPMADFEEGTAGALVYRGDIDLKLPEQWGWAMVSCCFAAVAATSDNYAFVRSNIVAIDYAGAP